MKKILLLIAIGVLLTGLARIYYLTKQKTTPANQNPNQESNKVEYINNQYGFKVSLPETWKGYKVVSEEWEGLSIGDDSQKVVEKGPMLSIRNPKWTQKNPYQDIPIMIFTAKQWSDMEGDKFHIGAAPINPSKLATNDKYIMALPARYNYAFPTGYEDVDKLIQNGAVQSINPSN